MTPASMKSTTDPTTTVLTTGSRRRSVAKTRLSSGSESESSPTINNNNGNNNPKASGKDGKDNLMMLDAEAGVNENDGGGKEKRVETPDTTTSDLGRD